MLDSIHTPLKAQPKHDENNYTLGSIGKHNVAITCLPEYGVVSAAVAAKSMQNTFPRLRFGLMVGIGGGIPSDEVMTCFRSTTMFDLAILLCRCRRDSMEV